MLLYQDLSSCFLLHYNFYFSTKNENNQKKSLVPGFFVFGGGVLVGGALAAGLGPNFLSLTSLFEAFIVSVIIASKGVCVCVCVCVCLCGEGEEEKEVEDV